MNAVYDLGAAARDGQALGKGDAGGRRTQQQAVQRFRHAAGPLTQFFEPPDTVWTPRVLKDGSDSVGALGALNRVYLNIGLFSEEWLLHFNPLVGGKPITPIEIAVAEQEFHLLAGHRGADAATWRCSFSRQRKPHQLKDAPGGDKYLTADQAVLDRGKDGFRRYLRALPFEQGAEAGRRPRSGRLRRAGLSWPAGSATGTGPRPTTSRARCARSSCADDFLDGNYLSTDLRVPVTLLQTNACSPLATNALAGNIWDNFSSQIVQGPAVGRADHGHDPFTGEPQSYDMPAGGRGYTRPAVADQPVVDGAVPAQQQRRPVRRRTRRSMPGCASFNASIEQMLWPEKRAQDTVLGDKVPGVIDRTTMRSEIRIPKGFLPDLLQSASGPLHDLMPQLLRRERRHQDRADPGRGAGQSAGQSAADPRIQQSARAPPASRAGASACWSGSSTICARCRRTRATRSCARNSPTCASRCWN